MVTNGAGKTQTPFRTLRAVSGVEQITRRHDFMVDGSWSEIDTDEALSAPR